MIEYNDGRMGEIMPFEEATKRALLEEEVKAIHVGTEEKLRELKQFKEQETKEVAAVVAYYGETLIRLEEKLDLIIKHFNIVRIIG